MSKKFKFSYLYPILFSVFLVSPDVNAGSYASLNVIGFSKDGKFLSFEESGEYDGSGTSFRRVFLINVVKNEWVKKPLYFEGAEGGGFDRKQQSVQDVLIEKELKALGIIRGNLGRHVISHPLTDLGIKGDSVQFAEAAYSGHHQGDYELTLTEREAKNTDCAYENSEDAGWRPKIFDLKLTDRENNKNRILQSDKVLPKSRDCASGYRIQDVYIYENPPNKYISVILNTYHPNIEGFDMRYMVVNGVIE